MNKDEAKARFQAAVASYRAGKPEEALHTLDPVVRAYPSHANSHYARAKCLASLGRTQEARVVGEFLANTLGDPRGAELLASLDPGQQDTRVDAPVVRGKRARRAGHGLAGALVMAFLRRRPKAEGVQHADGQAADVVPGGSNSATDPSTPLAEPGSATPQGLEGLPKPFGQTSDASLAARAGSDASAYQAAGTQAYGTTVQGQPLGQSVRMHRRKRSLIAFIILWLRWPWRSKRRAVAFAVTLLLVAGAGYLYRAANLAGQAGTADGQALAATSIQNDGGAEPDIEIAADAVARVWMTRLGGDDSEWGIAIAVDPENNVLITGWTVSAGWVSGGWDTTYNGGVDREIGHKPRGDAFVAKLSASGEHLWSTYLGGDHNDSGFGIAVDSAGNVLVTGSTMSAGWVSGGWNTAYNGNTDGGAGDAFVVKLSPSGEHLWSTYIGGDHDDSGLDIAVDGEDNVLVTGSTTSGDWASGGWDTVHNGEGDGFVLKLSPSGEPLWSTYLGGGKYDSGRGIAVEGDDNVLVTGWTSSEDWASGGWDTVHNGRGDGFALKLSPSGEHLWSTYFGGSEDDGGVAIAVDGEGNVLVTGGTGSGDWAPAGTKTAYDSSGSTLFLASPAAFVVRLSPSGHHLWSTFFGGDGNRGPTSIAADGDGNALVAFEAWKNFVAKLSPAGEHLWSSFLGGSGNRWRGGVTADGDGKVLVTGVTDGDRMGGEYDVIVMKLSDGG